MKISNKLIWSLLRLCMGWTFLWAFIDKLFGLGFSTCRDAKTSVISFCCDQAWINGGSPTFGFLKFGTKGPFASVYQGMASSALVEWMFMLGLLFIGATLLLGIMTRLGSYAGVAMLALMYTAGFIWPKYNPFIDEHIINLIIMLGLSVNDAGSYLGFGRQWSSFKFVKKNNIFK